MPGVRQTTDGVVQTQGGVGRTVAETTANTLISGFEDIDGSDFSNSAWNPRDLGSLEESSNFAVEGTQSLFHDASGFDSADSNPVDGLPIYIGCPGRMRVFWRTDNWLDTDFTMWLVRQNDSDNNAIRLRFYGVSGTSGDLVTHAVENGTFYTGSNATDISLPDSQWLATTVTMEGQSGDTRYGLAARDCRTETHAFNPSTMDRFAPTSDLGTEYVDILFSGTSFEVEQIPTSLYVNSGTTGYKYTFASGRSAHIYIDSMLELPA